MRTKRPPAATWQMKRAPTSNDSSGANPSCESRLDSVIPESWRLLPFGSSRLALRSRPWVWVVVGDLPSAYLDAEEAPTPVGALRRHIDIMRRWINAVRGQGPFDDNVAPVHVPGPKT